MTTTAGGRDAVTAYPVRVTGRLDEPLSRGLWLVKWILAIPHYLVLAFLWIGFVVLTLVAGVAILFTTRYPRPIWDFTVGVMRWSWRVHYYTYAALGTDRYPPFTLADVPDYPARLTVDYPERLNRWLVLVKWLLAIPHLIIVGVFAGGGIWLTTTTDTGPRGFQWAAGGLIGVLVLFAAIALLFTGRYPRPIFDFVMGMDRWVVRTGAYTALMTDEYPPFRLDLGETEPEAPPAPHDDPPPEPVPHRWTAGKITMVVIGALAALLSAGTVTGGVTLLWLDQTQRDDGFVSTSRSFATSGSAIASDQIEAGGIAEGELAALRTFVGDVRVEVQPVGNRPVFVGIAPVDDAARYLQGVSHIEVDDFDSAPVARPGSAVLTPPADNGFWAVQASGPGPQQVTWTAQPGDWVVVVANADGSPGVSAIVGVGAELPALPLVGAGLLVFSVFLLVVGGALVAVAISQASARSPSRSG
ncbi:MAG: DUF4389 domain-containing protein [Thermocrispum agreste]